MADDGGPDLPAPLLPSADMSAPEPLTPELAPFVAKERARLESATDGLDHEAAVRHLEAELARASVQASRLGFSFAAPEPDDDLAIGEGRVVVVQQLGDEV
jgi:hypothetical protein